MLTVRFLNPAAFTQHGVVVRRDQGDRFPVLESICRAVVARSLDHRASGEGNHLGLGWRSAAGCAAAAARLPVDGGGAFGLTGVASAGNARGDIPVTRVNTRLVSRVVESQCVGDAGNWLVGI